MSFIMFAVALGAIVGAGLVGDQLAGSNSLLASLSPAQHAVASPAASAMPAVSAAPAASAAPATTDEASPRPACDPPVIERLAAPLPRHSARLTRTGLESVVAPSAGDGQLVVDGRGGLWSFGSGRLAQLEADGRVVRGWTVADDARFDAGPVVGAADGGVWLASDAAGTIAWFDGKAFRDVIPTPTSATSTIAEAPDGSLWTGTWNAASTPLYHWDGTRWTGLCIDRGAQGIDRLAVDERGDVWATSFSDAAEPGVSRFDGREWTSYGVGTETSLEHATPQALGVGADGALWASFEDAVGRFTGSTWTMYPAPAGIDLAGTTAIAVDRDGDAWLAAGTEVALPFSPIGTHVVRFDGRAWREYGVGDGLPGPIDGQPVVVSSLAIGPAGVMAVSRGRLYRLAGERWAVAGEARGPTDAAALVAVSHDEAWVATSWGDIWHLRGQVWTRDGPPAPLGQRPSLAPGPGATIALATDRLVAVRHGGRWTVLRRSDSWTERPVIGFAPDGTLWSVADGGSSIDTYRYVDGAWSRHQTAAVAARVMPTAIAFDGAGHPWLMAAGGWVHGALFRLSGTRWTEVQAGDGLTPGRSIAVDPKGTIWLSLVRTDGSSVFGGFDGKRWRFVDAPAAGPDAFWPVAMTVAPDGALWASRGAVLARYDGRRWTSVEQDHFFDQVAIGDDGSVWTSGSMGIVRLSAR